MKLVEFLNPLLVSLFNKCASILWDIHRRYTLAMHKMKYVSWILHVVGHRAISEEGFSTDDE